MYGRVAAAATAVQFSVETVKTGDQLRRCDMRAGSKRARSAPALSEKYQFNKYIYICILHFLFGF